MVSISTRDAASLLAVVHDAATSDAGADPFPASVLAALARLIPSDVYAGYQEADVGGRFRILEQIEVVTEPRTTADETAYHTLAWQNPMRCHVHAQRTSVLRLSDLLTSRKRRTLEWDAVVWRPHQIHDALRLWLPAKAGRARSIYLERSTKDYTDREQTLLALFRPHLIRIGERHAASRRFNGDGRLTVREAEVLRSIADGRTNAEIAQLLVISPNTVRKHVENIFEKLGVHTRTAAAAAYARQGRARRDGGPEAGERIAGWGH